MKVLIDTNVALDILLKRPDYANAINVFGLAEKRIISGYISASAITDIFYLSKKEIGKKSAKEALKDILRVLNPATVTDSHIYHALNLEWDDFEDSVQYAVGESFSADYIITRNTQDYASGSIPAITPEQFIKLLTKDEESRE
jgi:predicted nucleic acid-binding protein